MGSNGLRAVDITKDYSGVPVLMGVSLSIEPGEIVGLVGHNGAGKSTLLKVFSGAHRRSGGDLTIDGKSVDFGNPSEAIDHGVSTVYQELSLLPNLTVTQNMFLGREETSIQGLKRRVMRQRAKEIAAEFGLDLDVDRTVGNYSMAIRQQLEIAIAVSKDTRYLLLDEPTTSLEGEQVTRLLDYVRNLAKERHIGVLIVNHKLDELYGVADRIVALTDGRVVIDAKTACVDRKQVVAAIAGEGFVTGVSNGETESCDRGSLETVMVVEYLESDAVSGVSFDVKAGEILGIYGLSSSGRTETLRTIAGIDKVNRYRILVLGKEYHPKSPVAAIRAGIAFVTEERKVDGIVPAMNAFQNASLPMANRFSRFGLLNLRSMRVASKKLLDALRLKGDPSVPITSLSGGNQQKVLIARALGQRPRILLLDEPTKGVDIGVKDEIYRLLRHLASEQGLAVVMVSSEEEEVLEATDSLMVFAGGRVVHGPVPSKSLSCAELRELSWTE